VSRTLKDSTRMTDTVLEVVKRDDGKFDLFLNRELDHGQVPESWLPEWLCVRFGFCGGEYDSILREVNISGKVTIIL
jgi:hypothetical protein